MKLLITPTFLEECYADDPDENDGEESCRRRCVSRNTCTTRNESIETENDILF